MPGSFKAWTVYVSCGWVARTNEIHQHIPLSSIIGGVGEEELDQASFDWLLSLSCFHIWVEEVVATLDLWNNARRKIDPDP